GGEPIALEILEHGLEIAHTLEVEVTDPEDLVAGAEAGRIGRAVLDDPGDEPLVTRTEGDLDGLGGAIALVDDRDGLAHEITGDRPDVVEGVDPGAVDGQDAVALTQTGLGGAGSVADRGDPPIAFLDP